MVNAKGFSGIFIVPSVTTVAGTGKIKRDNHKDSHSGSRDRDLNSSFSKLLSEAMEEKREEALNCQTTTYGRDSMLKVFFYQSGEYRYQ